jgi:uncharacterized C2H2 Zn-finger protein
MRMTKCLHDSGVSPELLRTRELMKCPKCGFEFNLMYSRAFACAGCRYSISGCNAARCPKCDHEFHIHETPLASDKLSSRHLGGYMSKIMSDYFEDFGESPSR